MDDANTVEPSFSTSTNMWQVLVDTIPSPIFYKDNCGVYLGYNQAFQEYIGPGLNLVGKSVFDVSPPELAQKYYQMDEVLFKKAGTQQYEASVRYADGTLHDVVFNKATFLNQDGTIGGLVGVMLDITQRKQYEVALQKQTRDLETVFEVSQAVATISRLDELLVTVVNLTKERFALYHAHIYLLNEAMGMLTLAAGSGEAGKQMLAQNWQIPLAKQQSLVVQVAQTRQGIVVNDVHHDPNFLRNSLLPYTQSELAVPMITGEVLLGVLDVQGDTLNRFSGDDIGIYTILAAQIATAISSLQQIEQFKRHIAREQAIREITTRLRSVPSLDFLAQTAANELAHYFKASHAHLSLAINAATTPQDEPSPDSPTPAERT